MYRLKIIIDVWLNFLEDRRCEGQVTFVREERGHMLSSFDSEIMLNTTLEECQGRCLSADT